MDKWARLASLNPTCPRQPRRQTFRAAKNSSASRPSAPSQSSPQNPSAKHFRPLARPPCAEANGATYLPNTVIRSTPVPVPEGQSPSSSGPTPGTTTSIPRPCTAAREAPHRLRPPRHRPARATSAAAAPSTISASSTEARKIPPPTSWTASSPRKSIRGIPFVHARAKLRLRLH